MVSKFFTAIRVAYVASQITAKHQLKPPPTLDYHHPIEQTLFDSLNGKSSGVFVHWGVYESGKSTAVREMAWRLQEEAGRQVIVLHGYDFSWIKPMSTRLRRAIRIPEDIHEPLSKLFESKATTLLIDNADMLMHEKDNRDVETLQLVRDLIKESEQTKTFNVLLVVNSWERAKELVDAGCELVPSDTPARWNRQQIESLFDTLPDEVKSGIGEKKSELLRLSTLSGTPGYLTFEAYGDKMSDKRSRNYAAMHDLEWRKGTKALYEGSQLDTEGRFPDRNGVYHHEDLKALPVPECF